MPRRSGISTQATGAGTLAPMSKRTNKARTRAKKNKANHGRKPNRGRG